MVARDEVVVEEVVVGLADSLQQARALLLDQRAAVQPQSEGVQPLLCTQSQCCECGQPGCLQTAADAVAMHACAAVISAHSIAHWGRKQLNRSCQDEQESELVQPRLCGRAAGANQPATSGINSPSSA